MIAYRTNVGYTNVIDEENCRVEINGNSFTIIKRSYGYDEYDWVDDRIENIIELRFIEL